MMVGDTEFTGLTLHEVTYTPPGKTLIDSMDYYVFVQATNMGVPRKYTTIISSVVEVRTPAPVHYVSQMCKAPMHPHRVFRMLSGRYPGILDVYL